MRNLIALPLLAFATAATAQAAEDRYIWLEDVQGERALKQVKQWNAAAMTALTAVPGFEDHRQRALAILNSPANIVVPDAVIGDQVLNHWVDAKNPRGIWRVATYQSFVSGQPQWRTLIDVDALGKAEGKSWVWHSADCLAPEYRRCLVSLSPGGGDADVVREFDLATGKFVAGGFEVPLSKNSVDWIDKDTILVGRASSGSETKSGYPIKLAEWKRGTALDSARVVATGQADDISMNAGDIANADSRYPMIVRSISYFDSRRQVRAAGGRWVELPVPVDADIMGLVGDRLVMRLDQPVANHPSGALVAYDFNAILKGGKPGPELILAPGPRQAIEQVNTTDNLLWVKLLEDVSGKLIALRRQPDGRWAQDRMSLPESSTVQMLAGADKRDELLVTVENFITPTSLVRVSTTGAATTVQSLPAQFDSSNMAVSQYFATSKDGTKVPYFVVRRKDVDRAGRSIGPCLWRVQFGADPDLSDRPAVSLGPAWPVPGRRRAGLCPRQHPRRRRIWAGVASRRASRKAAEQLRRSRGRRAGRHRAGDRAAGIRSRSPAGRTAACWSARRSTRTPTSMPRRSSARPCST